ncbi:MAG TPA: LPS export ABC transporter periplasmic protein LptC [Rhizomicrobium sp.]|nr:LPS export ABC transporter periplasmic protein LptC [Rhizomicrobium sp.]
MASGRTAKGAITQSDEPSKSRRDWTARARGTAMDAIRYSQFVALMKRALPIAAAAILAAVIVYSLLPRQPEKITITAERMGTIDNDLAMIKPRLTGTDNQGNPFVITAEVAVQDPKHVHRGKMKGIEADTTTQDGHWMNATASQGFFDMDSGLLKLRNGVSIYSDNGDELHTASVDIDMKKGLFHGPGVVTGHGPFGTLRADRFDADRTKQLIHLIGHVQMNFSTAGDGKK